MASTPSILSFEELARYSRQMCLPGVGLDGQERLRAARVLLIGLGGLGSPAALYLAAAGVGTLGLAETDKVEPSNLHRQILHDSAGIGLSKLASARARLMALNPSVTLREHPEGLTSANALALLAGYDVVLDGADNFPTRYLANDAAAKARIPLVHGSIFQFEGQVAVFDPARGGPCYRCLFPEMPAPGTVPDCAEAGVFGALCGVVGSMMAMEAIKLLLGLGEPLRGRLLAFDALNALPRVVQTKRDPHCPCCGTKPDARIAALDHALYSFACETPPPKRKSSDTNERFLRDLRALRGEPATHSPLPDHANPPLEIDVRQSQAWLQSATPPVVLDVREPFEVAVCHLPGSLAIPSRQLADHLDALPRDRPILILCHHGGRSMNATRFLRARGFDRAVNMRGGINAWAEEIDPAMPRY